jgi:hypothetical protein
MTTVHKYQGKSHCKTDERSDRGVEKWFPGMLPKPLWTLAVVYYCLGELLWSYTYFSIINQVLQLLEATCVCSCIMLGKEGILKHPFHCFLSKVNSPWSRL